MDADRPICREAAHVSFRRYQPPTAISDSVESLWTFEAGAEGGALTDRILPDMGTEVICRVDGARRAFLRGPRFRLEEIAIEPGARYVGARLRPGIGAELFKITAREACGSRLALADLDCPVLASEISGLQELVRALGDLFRQRKHGDRARTARRAADLIAARQGRISAGEVASAMGCSPRHLYREMMSDLGMGPKTVARIARLRRTIALLSTSGGSLAATAIDAGYADQAHMTREFSMLGMPSPARWRQWRESDFINTAQI